MESILFLSPSGPTAYGSAYLAKQLKAAGVDGVRAVDRDGHRSPVAFPKPGS
ncbi:MULTISPECIES: hypothetical protein [Micromonospora]|uniref:hypothetical protein n=1 Tax=Micromonospora TaxID=1873 RepID=UPI001374FD84|nr:MULTISPECIES: hypothetical protein [unclassified Micromonospora]MBM0228256.1 hypothetical protein [Micromonospora sp. ATA51]